MQRPHGRRTFLVASAAVSGAVLLPAAPTSAAEPPKPADVNATEDLMREHGVLRRVLLVYDESVRRIDAGNLPPYAVIASAANIVRRFIEGYHEKLEEQFVFPRMRQAGKLTDLVDVLLRQHRAGSTVTDEILQAASRKVATASARHALARLLRSFVRMYQPHAAREDTDLFPAYHAFFTEAEFDKLGDQFEEEEHRLLGSGGFEGAVKEVADLEQALGILDLAQFTPRPS